MEMVRSQYLLGVAEEGEHDPLQMEALAEEVVQEVLMLTQWLGAIVYRFMLQEGE